MSNTEEIRKEKDALTKADRKRVMRVLRKMNLIVEEVQYKFTYNIIALRMTPDAQKLLGETMRKMAHTLIWKAEQEAQQKTNTITKPIMKKVLAELEAKE